MEKNRKRKREHNINKDEIAPLIEIFKKDLYRPLKYLNVYIPVL